MKKVVSGKRVDVIHVDDVGNDAIIGFVIGTKKFFVIQMDYDCYIAIRYVDDRKWAPCRYSTDTYETSCQAAIGNGADEVYVFDTQGELFNWLIGED